MREKPLQQSLLDAFDFAALLRLRESHAQPASDFIRLPSSQLHFIDEGMERDLPPVVLLSAQWLGASAYDAFADQLTASTRVVRLDLPGHGLSEPFGNADYSAAAYARVTLDALDALRLDGAVLIGQSHSGIAAALAAADTRTSIRGLVLATSSGLPRSASPAGPSVSDGEERTLEWYRRKLRTLILRRHSPKWREKVAAETHDYNELAGRDAESSLRARAFDPELLAAILPRLAVPGLILWSERSTYLPPELGNRISRAWRRAGACHVIAGSGHLLIADAPAETADYVLGFLKGMK